MQIAQLHYFQLIYGEAIETLESWVSCKHVKASINGWNMPIQNIYDSIKTV